LIPYKNILCVIPARAGSQGIVDKNLLCIGGVPLVEHSILHALDAGVPSENIYVSSDSEEILHMASRNRVVPQKRPKDISGPESSTEEALLYALKDHLMYSNNSCDHTLLLQATSPIRFKGTVKRFIDFYLDSKHDSALTTTKFYDFFWKIGQPATSSYDPAARPMRQKLTEQDYQHFDNGNMYITKNSVLQKKKCRLGDNVGLFPISELEGMQIDTHRDLGIFRAVFDGKISEKVGLT
jgi:N-acylneuraminate cytidylyltransferase